MTPKPSSHVEPYDSHHMVEQFVKMGATFDRQHGSHQIWKLPDGRQLGAVINGKARVPSVLARQNAGVLGMDYPAFRRLMAQPVVKAGKRKAKVADKPRDEIGKADAIAAVRECADLVRSSEAAIRQGIRDKKFYADAYAAASRAAAHLSSFTKGTA